MLSEREQTKKKEYTVYDFNLHKVQIQAKGIYDDRNQRQWFWGLAKRLEGNFLEEWIWFVSSFWMVVT